MNTTCVPAGRLGVQRDQKNPWHGGRKEREGGGGGCQICSNLQLLRLGLTPLQALISRLYQEAVGGRKKG